MFKRTPRTKLEMSAFLPSVSRLILVCVVLSPWLIKAELANKGDTDQKLVSGLPATTDSSVVRVTARVHNREYCRWRDDSYKNLSLRLIIRFRNISAKPIILYKGTVVTGQMISLDELSAQSHKYVSESSLTVYGPDTSALVARFLRAPKPPKQFVLLRPNRFYETEVTSGVIISMGRNDDKDFGAILPGQYVLQLRLSNWWFGTLETAERLREQWRRTGLFWFQDSISSPLRVVVENRKTNKICP